MLKRVALVLAVVMMFVMVTNFVFADDKPVQKDKAACTMNKDGKCDMKDTASCDKAKQEAGCCTKDQAATQCPHSKEAAKSACKESSCKSSCPAQSACKAAEGEKK